MRRDGDMKPGDEIGQTDHIKAVNSPKSMVSALRRLQMRIANNNINQRQQSQQHTFYFILCFRLFRLKKFAGRALLKTETP